LPSLASTPADIDLVILSTATSTTSAPSPFRPRAHRHDRARTAEPAPLYFGSTRPIPWPDATYHLIDADTPVCEGLTLIPTPGHTPGHLSALVDLADGRPVILAADAINRASEPAEAFADAMDPAASQTSADRLLSLHPRRDADLRPRARAMADLPKAPQPW
jgi:N-acyl homoserine lactone hydrolase